MRTTQTLGEAKAHIDAVSRWNHDELMKVEELRVQRLDTLVRSELAGLIPKATHRMTEHAQRQLCTRLGVPFAYMDKCPEFLQQDNMNYWLPKERNEEYFVRLNGADDIRAIFTPRYVPVDNHEIVKRLLEIGYNRDTEVCLSMDDGFMAIDIPDPDSSFLLNGNDRFQHGIKITNSEIGISSLRVEAWVLRLVCMNGLVARRITGSFVRRHVVTGLVDGLPVLIDEVKKSREYLEEAFHRSLKIVVKDPEETFDTLNRRHSLSPKLRDSVAVVLAGSEIGTLFDVVQTYTRAAHTGTLSADEKYRLEEVGGMILTSGRAA